jgi:transposase
LDVHKHTVCACILDSAGKKVFAGDVACTRQGLRDFAAKRLEKDDKVVLEATTNTWAVVGELKPFVASVTTSNPLRTKAIAEAKVKTDKVDAEVLAQLLRCDYLPGVWEPDGTTRRLRKLTGLRASLVNERTRIKNRMRSVLAQLLIEPPVSWLFGDEGLEWLKGVELPEDERMMLECQLQLLASVQKELDGLDPPLQRLAYEQDKVRLLMTLPGVSHTIALSLLAALGDISRFRDGDHAASYLGLTPSTRQSAAHCYHGPITKAGNSHARCMLVQGAQHLATHPGPLGVFFRRLEKKKNRNVAVIASSRKLVTIAYLMLKNNEPYRYATPYATDRKLSCVRFRATGVRRKPARNPAKGNAAAAGKGGQPARDARATRSLPEIYHGEGLPPLKTIEQLPAGEQRVLKTAGVERFVRQVHAAPAP